MAAPVFPQNFNMAAVFGSADPFFAAGNVTPPGKLGYLRALNLLVLGAVSTPYAGTGLNTNYNDAAGSLWFWAEMFAPGTNACRLYVTRCPSFDSGDPGSAEVTNTTTDTVQIDIPPSVGDAVEQASMSNVATIDAGGMSAVSGDPGVDRVANVTSARAPALEEFSGTKLFGFGAWPLQSNDLTPL